MTRFAMIAGAAALVLGTTVSEAEAQCNFEHPKKARRFIAEFVQAFVSCGNPGGATPNDTTEGGIPSCSPPETFNTAAGPPANGWLWGPRSFAKVKIQAFRNRVPGPMNPDANSSDTKITFVMRDIGDQACTGCADGTGALSAVARATLNDRVGGDMTVVDFPANFPFELSNGRTRVRTSATVLLNSIGQPALPACASLELVSLTIIDENGNTFGNVGIFNNINKE